MTAKFLNNYPAKNALRIINQNRKFFIIIGILSLLGIPMVIFAGLLEEYFNALSMVRKDYDIYFDCEAYVAIGCFCAGIAVLMGMFCGIRAYEEEWNKTRVDMFYALPLNGTQRFFSNYAGGFLMYIIPYIASILIGWIILLIMIPMITAMDSTLSEDVSEIYLYYFMGSVGLGVLMWMFYSISTLCASCCGTMFENIYTNLLLNVLIPGTVAAVLASITNQISGIDFEYSWDVIGYMSPVGGAIYLAYIICERGLDSDFYGYGYGGTYAGYGGTPESTGLIPAYIRWIMVIIILTVAITILAWKLYQHRKAEQVGTPFIYSWIYYVILTSVTVCILCIATAEDDFAIASLIFSAIVYFIMEVIRKRGFKKFWFSVVTYIVTVAVSVGFFILAISTNCFGRESYIPPTVSVSSVEVNFDGDTYGRHADYHLIYQEKEKISAIRDFQKDILDNHESRRIRGDEMSKEFNYQLTFDNYEENYDYYEPSYENSYADYFSKRSFSIKYHTIAGTTIYRSYYLYHDEYDALIKIITGTEAYAQAQSSVLKNRIVNKIQTYNSQTNEYEFPAVTGINISWFPQDVQSDNNGKQVVFRNAEQSVNKLRDAYQNDLQNLTYEQYCTDEILGYVDYFPIFKSCSETISLLKEWGFTEFTPAQIAEAQLSSPRNVMKNALYIQLYEAGHYHTGCIDSWNSYLECANDTIIVKNQNADYEDVFYISENLDISSYCPELSELLAHARQHYISNEKCYLMNVNGNHYLIPESETETIEKLIKNDSFHYQEKVFSSSSNQYAF